jgi:hypothetical protein
MIRKNKMKNKMKTTKFIIAFSFFAASIFAQNALPIKESLVSKKGEAYLPVSEDWAISINASPFLTYAGNFIGGNGLNIAPSFNFLTTNQSIVGKYFIDDKTAYRAGIRIGIGSNTTSNSLIPAIPATTPVSYVKDEVKTSNTLIALTAGKEWRKGSTRLQGFYGGEAGISLGSSGTSYTYGNPITASNSGPRVTDTKNGTTFGIGVRAFIGAEYFILPKISIGGEFGWGLALTSSGEGENTTESFTAGAAKSTTIKGGPSSSSFSIDTDHLNSIFGPAATLRLTMHF